MYLLTWKTIHSIHRNSNINIKGNKCRLKLKITKREIAIILTIDKLIQVFIVDRGNQSV